VITGEGEAPLCEQDKAAQFSGWTRSLNKKGESCWIPGAQPGKWIAKFETINQSDQFIQSEVIADNGDEIKNREVANIVIRTDKPVIGGEFLINMEEWQICAGREITVAGGIITESWIYDQVLA